MYRTVCKIKDIIFQVSAGHDAMVNEYQSDQHKKHISMELRPNAIISAFHTNGVGGVAEQFRLHSLLCEVGQKRACCKN